MPSTTPQPQDGERADVVRNRAAILEAAMDVLAVAPSASLSEVAARAGLGRATLYRHFPSREALIGAIQKETLARASAALATVDLDGLPVREAVRRAVEVLVPLGRRFHVLLGPAGIGNPEFMAARERVLAPLFRLVNRATDDASGSAPGSWPAMVLSNMLMVGVRATDAGILDPDETAEVVTRTFFDGVTAERSTD